MSRLCVRSKVAGNSSSAIVVCMLEIIGIFSFSSFLFFSSSDGSKLSQLGDISL